jgi:hypothetical protein
MTPLWTYPEGHEPEWLDWSAHSTGTSGAGTGADHDPHLRIMELQAEVRNQAAEVWWLRAACVALAAAGALAWV